MPFLCLVAWLASHLIYMQGLESRYSATVMQTLESFLEVLCAFSDVELTVMLYCFSLYLKTSTSARLESLTAMLTQTASTVKAPITAFANLGLQEMEQFVQVRYTMNGETAGS